MAHYDLAVVGAGIHGAAVANLAARRGYSVAALEQYAQPGCGTSSKSSKLIHGGLRYLESGHFALVRECLGERRRLLREHPDLVRLVPFYIPVYRRTRRSPWVIATGLCLYALLGGGTFRRLPSGEWAGLDGLDTQDLKTVFRYRDAQTDDRRLTERLAEEASAHGAQLHYDAAFTGAHLQDGHWLVRFNTRDGSDTLSADALVNAAGPWVNRVLERVTPAVSRPDIELVQGTHIVIPGTLERGVYYLESPRDGRAVFVMPWHGRTLVGTTETPYHGDPGQVVPLESEIEYLLDTRNHYFRHPVKRDQVTECFAGLRVLPASDANPFHRSRETLLHQDPRAPKLLSICGGKLTSHHHTAVQTLQALGLCARRASP